MCVLRLSCVLDEMDDDEAADAPSSYMPSWDDLSEGGEKSWLRPMLPTDLNVGQTLKLQVVDCDYIITKDSTYTCTGFAQKQAQIRMYGVNDTGNSVMVVIHNFISYFYIQAINDDPSPQLISAFAGALDVRHIISQIQHNADAFQLPSNTVALCTCVPGSTA